MKRKADPKKPVRQEKRTEHPMVRQTNESDSVGENGKKTYKTGRGKNSNEGGGTSKKQGKNSSKPV